MTVSSRALTVERIKELLDYNPKTGAFTWKYRPNLPPRAEHWNRRHAGKPAGRINHKGYSDISINSSLYAAHRLAWMLLTGETEFGSIDHIDGCATNNSANNLRILPQAANLQNKSIRSSRNATGYQGITRIKTGWTASGYLNGQNVYLGLYRSLKSAVDVRHQWKKENCPGYTGRDFDGEEDAIP